jgi:hypothetical protein
VGYGILFIVSGFAITWLIVSVVMVVAAWRKDKKRDKHG